MDDTKRIIIGGSGAVVMVGGIGWAASYWFAAGHPSAWRLVPAVAMFVIGAGLFWWGFKSPSRKRVTLALLDDAIHGGEVLRAQGASGVEVHWRQWNLETFSMLRRWLGEEQADRFQTDDPGLTQGVSSALTKQIATLQLIRVEVKSQKGRMPRPD